MEVSLKKYQVQFKRNNSKYVHFIHTNDFDHCGSNLIFNTEDVLKNHYQINKIMNQKAQNDSLSVNNITGNTPTQESYFHIPVDDEQQVTCVFI